MLLKACQFSPEIRDHCRRIAAASYYSAHLAEPGRQETMNTYQRSLIAELHALLSSELSLTDLLAELGTLNEVMLSPAF